MVGIAENLQRMLDSGPGKIRQKLLEEKRQCVDLCEKIGLKNPRSCRSVGWSGWGRATVLKIVEAQLELCGCDSVTADLQIDVVYSGVVVPGGGERNLAMLFQFYGCGRREVDLCPFEDFCRGLS